MRGGSKWCVWIAMDYLYKKIAMVFMAAKQMINAVVCSTALVERPQARSSAHSAVHTHFISCRDHLYNTHMVVGKLLLHIR